MAGGDDDGDMDEGKTQTESPGSLFFRELTESPRETTWKPTQSQGPKRNTKKLEWKYERKAYAKAARFEVDSRAH